VEFEPKQLLKCHHISIPAFSVALAEVTTLKYSFETIDL